LSDKKERGKGYLEGYEAGLREAWDEFMGLCTKGYQSKEIRVLAKSEMVNIKEKLDAEKKRVEKSLGVSLDEPAIEALAEPSAEIRAGGTYLVEGGMGRALRLLGSLIERDWRGLCISRLEPNEVANRLGEAADTPDQRMELIWLTKTEVPDSAKGELANVDFRPLSPTSLDMLTTIMIDFLGNGGGKVIVLGGLDFLMTYNEFSNLLRLIQNMKDRISLSDSMMLISYDPKLLEERDLWRLKSEITESA
jgi:hypothetical protein